MNKTRIAINGFGRIGRMVFRQAINDDQLEVIAINASYPPETLAHLIKYDSVHGIFQGEVKALENGLEINQKQIKIVNSREPEKLPWEELNIDVVIEATGKFKTKETAGLHIKAGAKKVVITAPGKQVDNTIVMGVNEETYHPDKDDVISNASCTTNCLAPIAKVIDDHFKIVNGLMTTVHSFTNDQKNIDNPHKDLRRARGCTQSIIPTSTGAAKALGEVMPHLNGKLHGMALRVPTPNVSLVDLVVDVEKAVSVEEVNKVFKNVAQGELNGIIKYTEEPLVSIDYTTTEFSAIVDGLSTIVMENNKIKVLAWYDNEWGYSKRVVDLARYVGTYLHQKQVKIS
ncbi:glyceraldehyde-3-phosphate dehydrogenase [Virgibacillus halodenitrificans]|jgi:glyceraldehyde 3-phosphate dehydrogenase|uniref:Glyceraldehyde-3-phosphate dehydrogenase n=1 Tax=Virgibacillus halodenitrificans TaxID=1482 RepID=A0ABR7VP42_VIRHA|nr:glyceraldehyde-3-phosphate dehydrogenase [Virgibacillus halodenitrificans]MBD1223689.1 glyceraldehyde-3-phosphate dehydrogenase [Virgibacillus halodenitrificans]MEC2159883.1 glyceraldehyde-3-phosphate dehydrogenase [Virgibacillus halodenitrificans]MYL58997.1 glyceraldehyde-3-phosphate dehydrogenase [Virgibacillus halodenitrificans]WHX27716.1 glyceraldehyde-3-phosphate dehydrogenase [Virgibacillus halodenitrificans]CDQ36958.1 Glyceraldehyde-3-phosphate dehydrogenase 2 [Virgibacillus halodeni